MSELLKLQKHPALFRQALLIDTDDGPQPFGDCIDDWQRDDFAALDSGWQKAAGQDVEPKYQRGWLERGRGHSKTSDIATMTLWALFAARKALSGVAAAGDQDQARILRDCIGRLVYLNPWLSKIIEVQAYKVVNTKTGSTLEIISSDAPTSYGLLCDFIVADEIVHWRRRDLWDSLLSSAAKRSTCLLLVISNAGMTDDWQWTSREAVRTDPRWYFSRLDGPVASWFAEETLAEQERLLPSIAYRRLWLNEWTSGAGDALTEETIKSAFRQELRPQTSAQPGFTYVAGLDLGVSRDASAVCILGIFRGAGEYGKIRLAATKVWRPSKGNRVDLQEVEDALIDLHQHFNFRQLNFDPWEARFMASRLQSSGLGSLAGGPRYGRHRLESLPMVEVTPTGTNLQAMATAVIESFNDGRVELYNEAELKRDLTRLRIEERAYGFRLTAPHDRHGHGDLGTAFSLAMLAATEIASQARIVVGPILPHDPYTVSDAYRHQQQLDRDPSYHDDEPFREAMKRTGRYRGPVFPG